MLLISAPGCMVAKPIIGTGIAVGKTAGKVGVKAVGATAGVVGGAIAGRDDEDEEAEPDPK